MMARKLKFLEGGGTKLFEVDCLVLQSSECGTTGPNNDQMLYV